MPRPRYLGASLTLASAFVAMGARAQNLQDEPPPEPPISSSGTEVSPPSPAPVEAPVDVPVARPIEATSPAAIAAPAPSPAAPADASGPKITPIGYVEAYWAYNLRRPSNGITNYRGFDNRHNSFTLSNVALGADAEAGPMSARIVLQIGSTPSTYYGSEPARGGAAGANATGTELWKYLQEAYVGYKAPFGVLFQAGLFLSPIGYESIAVKDNWNWSRANAFFGLPFYHTGVRATYAVTDELTATASVYNGWNSVVDNNEEKSVEAHVIYEVKDSLYLQALYFGGVERDTGSPEGPYWRHHFDAVGEVHVTRGITLAGQADYGFEPSRIGRTSWWSGAIYGRADLTSWMYLALRGERFQEHLGTNSAGQSTTPIFWGGAEWIMAGTSTLAFKPHDHISLRLEHRLDFAEKPLFFHGDVAGEGTEAAPFVPNARYQETILAGATAWF